jgi:hypothetical protein
MQIDRWIAHFERNRLDRPEPDWASAFTLPEGKRAALARSLAEYQLGDGGGECRLIASDAGRFRQSRADMGRLVDLWFAEEKEHSRLLWHAVKRTRGEFITSTFAFRLFNACRRSLGVQFEMLVLLLVEIVSTGYYRVMRRHCGDEPIADMCKLILRDEARHIDFHRDRLAARHPEGPGAFWALRFRFLGWACAWFLWRGHGRDLATLGATRAELFEHVASGMRNFLAEFAHAASQNACAAGGPNPVAASTHS